MRLEEGVDGAVAVRMQVERHAHLVHALHHLVDGVLWERQLAAPALLAARTAREVGGGEESRLALRRAVDGDLHAADLEVIVVLAPTRERYRLEDLVQVGDEGIRNDVDDVGARSGGALHHIEVGRVGGALVGGGHP